MNRKGYKRGKENSDNGARKSTKLMMTITIREKTKIAKEGNEPPGKFGLK